MEAILVRMERPQFSGRISAITCPILIGIQPISWAIPWVQVLPNASNALDITVEKVRIDVLQKTGAAPTYGEARRLDRKQQLGHVSYDLSLFDLFLQ
jgi:hypothetical protein